MSAGRAPIPVGLALAVGAPLLLAGLALLAPLLPLPSAVETDLARRLLPPGAAGHPLGTDHLGRDLLARLLLGTRASLVVALLGTAVAAGTGTLLGLVAGWRGGRVDTVLMRAIDALLAFPYMLLALALVALLGPSLENAALAVAIVNVPFFARTVRGSTLALRGRAFVEVARLSGHGEAHIVAREVLPNVLPVVIVATSTTLGWMVLETAGLSFLGLGAQPPRADLGSLLGEGRRFLGIAPHLVWLPGLVIFALALGVNRAGDALRDRLDPRRPAAGAGATLAAAPGAARGADCEAAAAAPLLEVRDLTVAIPGAGAVVEGVGFAVGAGEAVALVGESGSGKTVTAMTLLGLAAAPGARVVAGAVRWRGADLLRQDPAAWRRLRGDRIGFVPQDPGASLDPLRTIGAQLVEIVRAHRPMDARAARARAAELLARVHLPRAEALLDAHPHELSGGMKQRVLVAAALAGDPDLLVADEPTTALDVTTRAEILALLAAIRRERGVALLLVTHDFGVVSELCERVLVMRAGRLVEAGSVAQVIGAPRHDYTRALLAAVPRLRARRPAAERRA